MSVSREQLKVLRQTLVRLFPLTDRIAMVVQDAGLDWTRINASGSPEVVWHHVLEEARRQGALTRLVETAAEVYPGNADLQAFLRGAASSGAASGGSGSS